MISPYLSSFVYHGPRVLAKKVIRKKFDKDSSAVNSFYDPLRRRFKDAFEEQLPTLEEFDTLDASLGHVNKHGMLNGAPSNDAKAIRNRYIEEILAQVDRFGAESIIEIGPGYGRNVLALKNRRPRLKVVGLELSEASVELSRAAAERYGLDCEFRQFDATDDWSGIPPVDIILSVHALEQIMCPAPIIDRMVARANKAVVVIEPFPDLWKGLKGVAQKLRALDGYRLRSGSFARYQADTARLLDYGHSVNQSSLVVIRTQHQ